MSCSIEGLESRALFAADPNSFVVSFYGLGGSGGFGNDWLDKVADKAGAAINATVRNYDEDEGGTALKDLFRSLDDNHNHRIDKKEAVIANIRVIGYSAGGIQAANFARSLLKVGSTLKGYVLGVAIPIRSLVTLDPVDSILKHTDGVPNNVYNFSNYYQRRGGNTTIDLYTHSTPSFKVSTLDIPDPTGIIGNVLVSKARKTRQVRIDTDLANETETHKIRSGIDGKIKGRNVNHGTLPFFAYDFVIADLTA